MIQPMYNNPFVPIPSPLARITFQGFESRINNIVFAEIWDYETEELQGLVVDY